MKNSVWIPLAALCLFSACLEHERPWLQRYPVVQTDTAVFASEALTFSAKLLSLGETGIDSVGLAWSYNAGIDKTDSCLYAAADAGVGTVTFSLSSRIQKRKYYYRAFVVAGETIVYGDERVFNCPSSSASVIDSFVPKKGVKNTEVVIWGKNLAPNNQVKCVFFGQTPATVVSATVDRVVVRAPDYRSKEKLTISIRLDDKVVESADSFDFYYPWKKKCTNEKMENWMTQFSVGLKWYTIGFASTRMVCYEQQANAFKNLTLPLRSTGAFDHIGSGYNGDTIWRVDQNSNQLRGCATGDKAYVFLSRAFWEFTPGTNVWIRKKDYPGNWSELAREMFMVACEGKVYFGRINDSREIWCYNPLNDTWTLATFFPEFINDWISTESFCAGRQFYICLNSGYAVSVHCYNPDLGSWTRKNSITNNNYSFGVPFAQEDKAYCLMSYGKLSQYNPATDAWNFLTSEIPEGLPRYGFILGGKVYVGGNSILEYIPAD